MTDYEKKVLEAWRAINRDNGGKGASAAEVTAQMAKAGTLSALDTVIDIADIMETMSARGDFAR